MGIIIARMPSRWHDIIWSALFKHQSPTFHWPSSPFVLLTIVIRSLPSSVPLSSLPHPCSQLRKAIWARILGRNTVLPLKQCVLIIYALLFTPLDLWLGKLRNLQFYERRPWFGIMLMIYLVGVLRNEGKGRAVRTSAWSTPPPSWSMLSRSAWFRRTRLVKNVVKKYFFGFLNLLLTEKRSFPSGRDIGDDHCEEDHHRHHRCDPHCYLCISFKNNSELSMIRAQNAFPE